MPTALVQSALTRLGLSFVDQTRKIPPMLRSRAAFHSTDSLIKADVCTTRVMENN